ncbi:MAG: hypothetical protein ACREX8_00690 [Gammaproteobacteria bacterium]
MGVTADTDVTTAEPRAKIAFLQNLLGRLDADARHGRCRRQRRQAAQQDPATQRRAAKPRRRQRGV